MKLDNSQKSLDLLVKAAAVTGISISLFLVYYYLMPAFWGLLRIITPLLLPFILAGVIAVLIDPLVNLVCRYLKMPRGWAVLAMLVIFLAAISAVLTLLISRLILELLKLSKNIPDLTYLTDRIMNEVQYYYYYIDLRPQLYSQLQEYSSNIALAVKDLVSLTINGIVNVLASLPSMFIFIIVMIIATFFISRDKELVQKFLVGCLPKKWRENARVINSDLSQALVGYFRAQLTLICISTIISITGLAILGVPYALTIGLIVGCVDILPVFGPGAVYVPWIIIQLISQDYKTAIGLLIIYVIIVVNRQVMEPKLVAKNIGAHPLATLVAIFVGLKLLGVWGIVLGPALLVTARAVKKVF